MNLQGLSFCGCGRPTRNHKGACSWRRLFRRPQKVRRDKGSGMSPAHLKAYKAEWQRAYIERGENGAT